MPSILAEQQTYENHPGYNNLVFDLWWEDEAHGSPVKEKSKQIRLKHAKGKEDWRKYSWDNEIRLKQMVREEKEEDFLFQVRLVSLADFT